MVVTTNMGRPFPLLDTIPDTKCGGYHLVWIATRSRNAPLASRYGAFLLLLHIAVLDRRRGLSSGADARRAA